MKFNLEDVVYHSKFGVGQVQKIHEDSSVVSFNSGHIEVSNEFLNSVDISPKKHFWPLINKRKIESKYFKKDVYYNSHLAEPAMPPSVGLLGYVGYKTGIHGLPSAERIKLLTCVFHNELPNVDSKEYMNLWGKPGSDVRFGQMKSSVLNYAKSEYFGVARMDRYRDLVFMEKLIYDKECLLTRKY